MNHISGAIGFSRSAGDKWALEGRIARSLSSGVTVSTVNSAAMKLLDYAIVPRIWLTPNSRLHCPSSKHLAQIGRGGKGERASSGVGF